MLLLPKQNAPKHQTVRTTFLTWLHLCKLCSGARALPKPLDKNYPPPGLTSMEARRDPAPGLYPPPPNEILIALQVEQHSLCWLSWETGQHREFLTLAKYLNPPSLTANLSTWRIANPTAVAFGIGNLSISTVVIDMWGCSETPFCSENICARGQFRRTSVGCRPSLPVGTAACVPTIRRTLPPG